MSLKKFMLVKGCAAQSKFGIWVIQQVALISGSVNVIPPEDVLQRLCECVLLNWCSKQLFYMLLPWCWFKNKQQNHLKHKHTHEIIITHFYKIAEAQQIARLAGLLCRTSQVVSCCMWNFNHCFCMSAVVSEGYEVHLLPCKSFCTSSIMSNPHLYLTHFVYSTQMSLAAEWES